MAKRKKPPESSPEPAGAGSAPPEKKARCPRCTKEFVFTTVAGHKPFPFCSQRCRDVDLGNWIMGKYAIPGDPVPQTSSEDDPDAT
jgi:endogenous inhibitor of DNA gyrase (YacG/DUF329 family)